MCNVAAMLLPFSVRTDGTNRTILGTIPGRVAYIARNARFVGKNKRPQRIVSTSNGFFRTIIQNRPPMAR